MTGNEYADLIASYVAFNFQKRGIKVYREVDIGKTIIGKNRKVDVFVVCEDSQKAFAIECKYQSTSGTTDEKIPYALSDVSSLRIEGCLVYTGDGFSSGVLHMLQASETAAYCSPNPENLLSSPTTKELDHMLAMHFGWWDILIGKRKAFQLTQKDTTNE